VHQRLDARLAVSSDPGLASHAATCAACDAVMRDFCWLEVGLGYGKTVSQSFGKQAIAPAPALPVLSQRAWEDDFSTAKISTAKISPFKISPFKISTFKNRRFQLLPIGRVVASIAAILFLSFSMLHLGNRIRPGAVAQPRVMVRSNAIASATNALRDLRLAVAPTFAVALGNPAAAAASGSWGRLSGRLEPLSPYWQYTVELPGVRPMQSSVNLTIELLQRSLAVPDPPQPELGWFPELAATASA
jgi:hypothetical protein